MLHSMVNELLQVDDADCDENLFLLGFDSIMLVQLIGKIKEQTGAEIPLRALFEGATIRSLSEYI